MLHNNISATHKAYGFNSLQMDINNKYQYLDKDFTQPATLKDNVAEQARELVDVNLDTPEQRNILFAKNIALHRYTLKTMLSEVPLSALWLLNEHGQNRYMDIDMVSECDEAKPNEQIISLSALYQNAVANTQKYGLGSSKSVQSKQQLSNALKNFELTAEQLKHLATIITYAYLLEAGQNSKYGQVDLNTKQTLACKARQLITIDVNELEQELHNLGFATGDPELVDFLLPPDNQLHTSLRHLIRTQTLWLSARQKLAEANSRLVLFMANQYKGGFLEFNDLVQEGQIGLLKAVDRFDYQRGFKFSTYAVYWIRQGISRGLARSERLVRLPFGQIANISKVYRAKELFFAKTGQEMPMRDLAAATKMSEAEIVNILLIGQSAASLDAPISEEDSSGSIADFMEQQVYDSALNKIANQELINLVNNALSGLSEKEAQVICGRFGIHRNNEMTLEEIGQTLNLTRERVRQIQTTALKKLKLRFGADLVHFL